ncbi:hypothetical protein ACHAP3_008901 [Botrytis cinerea]|nr:hypothetical protein BcDW1_927 [Botrytis cinerea BcDW1]
MEDDRDHDLDHQQSEIAVGKWRIGWFTPTLIATAFIAGMLSASAHYLVFWILNGRDVDSSIPQSWVSPISTALGRAFSISLGVALGTAYTQLLWNRLRRSPTKIGTIECLFLMQSNPLKLVSLAALKTSPLLWLAAAFIPIVPTATIFPPGAIVVVPSPQTYSYNTLVPTYDFDYRGQNDSYENLAVNALFLMGPDGEVRYSKPYLGRIARATAMSGSYLTTASPCGSNCTYEITMPGPEFSCQEGITSDLSAAVVEMYGNVSFNGVYPSQYSPQILPEFIAAEKPQNESDGRFEFELQWNGDSSMTCTVWYSEYTLTMNYTGGRQETTLAVKRGHLLNSTYLTGANLFYMDSTDRMTYPDDWILFSGQNVSTTYRESNVHSVYVSVTDALKGAASGYGTEGFFVANTIILETPLASYSKSDVNDVTINLDAQILQSLLQNITISLLSLSNTNIFTEVTTTRYINQYEFAYSKKLVLPYAAALFGTLIFLVMGTVALAENGVAATGGGFLQLLCTTKGSSVLDDMVRGASLGGSENVSQELESLAVRYGELTNAKGELKAGFGVEDEVRGLVKGRNYR